MAQCEFRITPEEAHKQVDENLKSPKYSKKMARGMVIAFFGPAEPMCQLFMNAPAETDGAISCAYPTASTETCPYAREAKGLPELPTPPATQ